MTSHGTHPHVMTSSCLKDGGVLASHAHWGPASTGDIQDGHSRLSSNCCRKCWLVSFKVITALCLQVPLCGFVRFHHTPSRSGSTRQLTRVGMAKEARNLRKLTDPLYRERASSFRARNNNYCRECKCSRFKVQRCTEVMSENSIISWLIYIVMIAGEYIFQHNFEWLLWTVGINVWTYLFPKYDSLITDTNFRQICAS